MTLNMQKCCIKNYFDGGHAQNRTGIQGFAILCVTIPLNFNIIKTPNSQNLPEIFKLNFAVNIFKTQTMI